MKTRQAPIVGRRWQQGENVAGRRRQQGENADAEKRKIVDDGTKASLAAPPRRCNFHAAATAESHSPAAPPDGDRNASGSVSVLFPLAAPGPYRYVAPATMERPSPGRFALAPLGGKTQLGVVWESPDRRGESDGEKPIRLKALHSLPDIPPLGSELRRFIDWMAAYTLTPPGMALRLATRAPLLRERGRARDPYYLAAAERPRDLRLTAPRRAALDLLADGMPRRAAVIAERSGVSKAVIHALSAAGALIALNDAEAAAALPLAAVDFRRRESLSLNALLETDRRFDRDQRRVRNAIAEAVKAGRFQTLALEGVTGSGKTEIYLDLLAEIAASGRQGLALLPEIALTSRFLDRFESRFGLRPAAWHSAQTPARRAAVWRGVAEKEIPLVIGARSALFLPFADLGLIVVDEEHDAAFKQQDATPYHARDMAVARAAKADIPILLSSATLSLETEFNLRRNRYRRLTLTKRWNKASLPTVEAIDLRRRPPPPDGRLSQPLIDAVAAALKEKRQTLLFLNRRGYAPLTLCRDCGERIFCDDCDLWMTEHRRHRDGERRLLCHHCGCVRPYPRRCRHCDGRDSFIPCGPGVERIDEEVARIFPEARRILLSSDRKNDGDLSSSASSGSDAAPPSFEDAIRRIEDGDVDIVIGTQIVAKGYHFPNLTLVGVVDADIGLGRGDLRDSEHNFQLLHQVAGRAGRRPDRPGRVLVQTRMPEHPIMKAVLEQDRDAFLHYEMTLRAQTHMPPFSRLAAVILVAEREDALRRAARSLAKTIPSQDNDEKDRIRVFGPKPIVFLKRRHRLRFLVKAPRRVPIQPYLRRWLAAARPALRAAGVSDAAVRLHVDVDPYSFA